jgi:hypothetical protein
VVAVLVAGGGEQRKGVILACGSVGDHAPLAECGHRAALRVDVRIAQVFDQVLGPDDLLRAIGLLNRPDSRAQTAPSSAVIARH